MSQRDVIFQCRIVGAELRGTNSDMKIGGGLRRNRGGVQRGGVRPPVPCRYLVSNLPTYTITQRKDEADRSFASFEFVLTQP